MMSIQDESKFGQKERDSNGEKKSKAPLFRARAPSKVKQKRERQITDIKSKTRE